jgi:hypothetical protein
VNLQEPHNNKGRNQMWIKTFRTEEMRQHLEGEFPMHLAVEQRFPSHPNGKITFRAYKTNIDGVCIEGENYLDLRAKIASRKI